jgi:hypothetical protein
LQGQVQKRARRRAAGLAFALGLALASPLPDAAAAPGAGAADTEVDRLLRSVVEAAKAKVAADDYRGALKVLTDAYERAPHPALLWPIAELHLQLQQPGPGLAILDRYVMLVPVNKMPPGQQMADVGKMRAQFQTMFAQLTVHAYEPGATVFVDGKPAGQVPLGEPIRLDPGAHRVELQVGRSAFREVTLKPGEAQAVELTLAPEAATRPAAPPPKRGVRTAACVLTGIGVGAVIAGAVLWGLDGLQSCPAAPMCPTALDSRTTGIGVFSAGLGLTASSLILLGVELGQKR